MNEVDQDRTAAWLPAPRTIIEIFIRLVEHRGADDGNQPPKPAIAHDLGGFRHDWTVLTVMAGHERYLRTLRRLAQLLARLDAGVWANRAQAKWNFIEPGDVDSALQTASAIGDDRLQRRAQGYVVPDAFTHGTSAQRIRWFLNGLKSGQVASCDTLRASEL